MKKHWPELSVIVPIAYGEEEFSLQRQALSEQIYPSSFEIIYIDSRADKSPPLSVGEGCKVIEIEKAEFKHGASRNLGVKAALGEVACFLSEDAIPSGRFYLYRLIERLCSLGEGYAGVSARQMPRSGARLFSRYSVLSSPYGSPREIESLPLNNVASAVWREKLIEMPFPEDALFGEDALFTRLIKERSFKTGYAPMALVIHSHERSAKYIYWRYYADAYLWQKESGREKNPASETKASADKPIFQLLGNSPSPLVSVADFLLKAAAAWFGARAGRKAALKGEPPASYGKV